MSAIVSGGAGAIGAATISALAKAGAALIGIVGRTQKTLDEVESRLKLQYPGHENRCRHRGHNFLLKPGTKFQINSSESQQ
jgi:NAD(P)-dependent dehydrogenase (short-subunit alcohol dehydrogenase family)